jgi:hypothetical protein
MFGDDEPSAGENPSPRTTIVGGRPPERRTDLPPVPVGLQRLLRLASVDAAFRRTLVARRAAVAEAAGVRLTPSETAVLAAIPAGQLERMAERMPPPPAARRDFLRRTAATAVVLLGGAVLSGNPACTPQRTGVAETSPAPSPAADADGEEAAPPRPGHREMDEEGGMSPGEDLPPRPNYREMEVDGGISPDIEDDPEREQADAEEVPDRPYDPPPPPAGIRPDLVEPVPPPPPPPTRPPVSRGIAPDVPIVRPVHNEVPTTGGAAPDLPGEPESF